MFIFNYCFGCSLFPNMVWWKKSGYGMMAIFLHLGCVCLWCSSFAWTAQFYWNNQQTVFWNSTQDSGICLVYFNSPVSQLMQFPGLNSCCMMVRHLNTPNHNRIIEKWFVAASGCLHVVFFQLVYWNQIPFIWGFPNYVVYVSLRRPNPQTPYGIQQLSSCLSTWCWAIERVDEAQERTGSQRTACT